MVIWGRFLFNFLFVAIWYVQRNPGRLPRTQRPLLQVVRSLLMIGSTVTFWWALMYLPLASAVAIGFATPLLVTALSVPMLKETVGIYRWSAVVVGFIGVLVIIRPGLGVFHWAALLPLATALFYANYQIVTRLLSRSDDAMITMFWTAAGGLAVSSLVVPFHWTPLAPMEWLLVAWLGFLGTIGHFFLIRAIGYAPVSVLAPFNYLTLLWATALGFVLFGDLPDFWTVVGSAIVIGSGLFIIYRERVRRAQRQ